MRSPRCDRVEAEIAALPSHSRAELLEHWRMLHSTPPPKGISRALLIRAIAYAMQAKRCGGLKPTVIRRLRKAVDGSLPEERREIGTKPRLKPGARLVREWNGVTHVVEVVEEGFVWNGTRFNSLSAVARAITGARWSGPRFFALTAERWI